MNKKIFLLTVILIFTKLLIAVPAYPGLVSFVQPDGISIDIYIKGDERIKWAETVDGYSLLFNEQGYYEYTYSDFSGNMTISGIRAYNIDERTSKETEFLKSISKKITYSKSQINILLQIWNIYQKEGQKSFPTTGQPKLLCVLIGFTDKLFTKTQNDFDLLFNQVGYNVGGATGSVYDYFYEASYQQLELDVTVKGPYTAANNRAYYGANDVNGNDVNPDALIIEAMTLANNDNTDFTQFDNDSDGEVEGVYVIYAGVGEEAGGGANAIWAHASYIDGLTLDGKTISRYSCSSEFRSGTSMTRIGVICHEFGHVLGAPDFYDTDYSASGGDFNGTGEWDLQAMGSWNGANWDGATPAHPNAYTKCYIYEWTTPTVLTTNQTVTLTNSAQNTGQIYRYDTKTTNEFFIMENRQQVGFDLYIPGKGLIIYHADGTYINNHPYDLNAGSHQGLYPVCASATVNPSTTVSSYGSINTQGCAWPYSTKTSFTDDTTPWARSWAGVTTSKPITSITHNTTNKTITLNFANNLICEEPLVQATNFSATNITANSMTINWTRGDGDAVIVIARKGGSVNALLENSTYYSANSVFGSGTLIGTDNYVVYNGSGTSVNVTNLIENKNYYYGIYEYFSATNCYLTPPLSGHAQAVYTSIFSFDNDNEISIYPNPVEGILNINFNDICNDIDLQIYTIEGKLIYQKYFTGVNKNQTETLDLNILNEGIYIAKFITDELTITKSLIIK